MELRGNSRMSGKPAAPARRTCARKDIDLAYAEDGRTLQSAKLVENAVRAAAGREREAGPPDRRQGDRHRDGARRRDGDQSRSANENVQVDLPRRRRDAGAADPLGVAHGHRRGRRPASRRRRSRATSSSARARAASGKLPAIDRTREVGAHGRRRPSRASAISSSAEFHGNVHFTDGPQTTADAPTAVYDDRAGQCSTSAPARATRAAGRTSSDGRITRRRHAHPDGAHQPEAEGRHRTSQQRHDAAVGQARARAGEARRARPAAGEDRHAPTR